MGVRPPEVGCGSATGGPALECRRRARISQVNRAVKKYKPDMHAYGPWYGPGQCGADSTCARATTGLSVSPLTGLRAPNIPLPRA